MPNVGMPHRNAKRNCKSPPSRPRRTSPTPMTKTCKERSTEMKANTKQEKSSCLLQLIYSSNELTGLYEEYVETPIGNDSKTNLALQVSASSFHRSLTNIGHRGEDINEFVRILVRESKNGKVGFKDFSRILESTLMMDGREGPPDSKIFERRARLLEDHRLKCELVGDYLEASKAHNDIEKLSNQAILIQEKILRNQNLCVLQKIQKAHDEQVTNYKLSWDSYLKEYDTMAQEYVKQFTQRHLMLLVELQESLQQSVKKKEPKWSRELLDWRRRQHLLAQNQNYAEAERIKKIADRLEESEQEKADASQSNAVSRKELAVRDQHQAELQALLKRIDMRRKEHVQKCHINTKQLLQRNRNIQASMQSKYFVELKKLTSASDVVKAKTKLEKKEKQLIIGH